MPERKESEDPLNILPDSADLPANQRTKSHSDGKFDNSPFEVNPVAAFQDMASGLIDDKVFTLLSTSNPIGYREAMKLVQCQHWQEVIENKIAALERHGVWEKYKPEDISAGHSTMGLRFAMRAKTNK